MQNRNKHGITVCITQIVGTKKIHTDGQAEGQKSSKKTGHWHFFSAAIRFFCAFGSS